METKTPIYNRINLIVNKTELEYILGLIESDLKYELYDTKRLLVLNNLYSKLINLNK
tara:strand:+ start:162 stop:332 length:171 start_codon:yes stop_codon:yes gene_type:complete